MAPKNTPAPAPTLDDGPPADRCQYQDRDTWEYDCPNKQYFTVITPTADRVDVCGPHVTLAIKSARAWFGLEYKVFTVIAK